MAPSSGPAVAGDRSNNQKMPRPTRDGRMRRRPMTRPRENRDRLCPGSGTGRRYPYRQGNSYEAPGYADSSQLSVQRREELAPGGGPRGRGDEWHIDLRKQKGTGEIGERGLSGDDGGWPPFPHRHGGPAMPRSRPASARKHVRSLRRQFLQDGGLPFTDVLTEQVVAPALAALTGWLDRIYSPLVTLWVFLGQVLSADHSCRAAIARLLAHRVARGQSPCSARTGAYCQARQRLPESFFADVARQTGRALEDGVEPAWLWKGRRVYVYDGS